ncbi:MAG: L,D-transpeptidase [Thermomicrobiales bacterium]|nr:L,D-transpeptidase [Thermomicrobiales bacterium]MCO5218028.1 L,D-transpeptidase [Thermomicrobiales bacterium]MCO5224395.1 L,D-transpeptidase [Thermomicrobiales bacterium]MCO5228239.1 L,D-transpeptidase [Thermomicrobiales bacterium]
MFGTRLGLRKLSMLIASLAMVLMSIAPGLATPAAAQWSAPRTVYFQETGQSLDQLFLDFWRGNNGRANYGLPITPEITLANGHIIQYLQYARFEYWPEGGPNGRQFQLGKVGQDMRPQVLQRSLIASTSVPNDLTPATDLMKAWLPISPDSETALDPNVTYVPSSQHTIFGAFRDFWWATGDVNYLGNPISQEYTVSGVTYQAFEYGQLRWTPDEGVQMVPVGEILAQKYDIATDPSPQGDIPTYAESLFIPPIKTFDGYVYGGGQVWVDINLSWQYMTIFQGDRVLYELYISSGRSGFDTPTGTFYVLTMYPSDDMEGVLGGEYYNVPSVPDVLYFTNEGHAIHGTYWHNNFGTPMSHGCINMPEWAAEYLYNIAYIGMPVVIHY